MSGFKLFKTELKAKLSKGLQARFVVGLDFYLTEPEFLSEILSLSQKFEFPFYVCNSIETFHPKIYAVSYGESCTVLIGSANLTAGGLQDNFEATARIDDPSGAIMEDVTFHINDLIKRKLLVSINDQDIKDYAKSYEVHHLQRHIAKWRAQRTINATGINVENLKEILIKMRSDSSDDGFDKHQIKRRKHQISAVKKMSELAHIGKLSKAEFLKHYEELIDCFHSGGLHRGKTIVTDNGLRFQEALAAILESKHNNVIEDYQLLLDYFRHIDRAGINVLTEVLQALNSERFAVMNQNAVSGMRKANILEFPPRPSKWTVSAEDYSSFCEQAEIVRRELGLANFLELDALFNYTYWKHRAIRSGAQFSRADRAKVFDP
jgi:phosphatidylserine/phosphatidylglycerophosphate/cardiolipin synthase-like enzyme